MKLYLDKNIAKGTPEELAKYKELISNHQLDRFKEVSEDLFSFGHTHEAEDIVEEDSMHDEGAFYTVTEEAGGSPLTVGTILLHQHGNLFIDSIGHRCRISRPSFVERGLTHGFEDKIKQDRFELAKELGIHLTSSTNFAVEASDRTFKLKEEDTTLTKGELVKIIRDDSDRLPLVQSVEDSDRRRDFVYISKLEVVQDNLESTESSTDEEESPSTELKVGDRVKVLKSEYGAEEEATVTAVLEDGDVELAGTSKSGKYLTNWSNHASNLKKIGESTDEEQTPSLEDNKYYEVIDNGVFADSIEKGTVVKAGNYTNLFNCITSDGVPQIAHPDELKLLQGSHIKDRFEFAEMTGVRLTFSTDLAEECKDHLFQLTHDEDYSGSAFSKGTAVKIDFDDGSSMPRFKDEEHEQFVYLGALKEIARPSK